MSTNVIIRNVKADKSNVEITHTSGSPTFIPYGASRTIDLDDATSASDVQTLLDAGSVDVAGDLGPILTSTLTLHLWVDEENGDDENSGFGTVSSSEGRALKTHGALTKKVGPDPWVRAGFNIHAPKGISEDSPAQFDGDVNIDVDAGGYLRYTTPVDNVKTVLRTGTFTGSVVEEDPDTNVFWEVTDSAMAGADDWAALEFRRLRNTTQGIFSAVARNEGSKTASTAEWVSISSFPDCFINDFETPEVGDTYKVEELWPLYIGELHVKGAGDIFQSVASVAFENFDLNKAGGATLAPEVQGVDCRFYACTFGVDSGCAFTFDMIRFCFPLACVWAGDIFAGNGGAGAMWPQAGLAGFIEIDPQAIFFPDGNFLVRGEYFVAGGTLNGSKFAAMEGDILVSYGGRVFIGGGMYGFAHAWGGEGDFYFLMVTSGEALIGGFNDNNKFVGTCAQGDFSLGTSGDGSPGNKPGDVFAPGATARSSTSATADNTCTWAQFEAAVGSDSAPDDGFGFAALNQRTLAKLSVKFD